MEPIATYRTNRLILNELSLNDAEFILELVNTDEWKKFIGDRNIHTEQDARIYIQKVIDNPNINYWVVKTKEQQIPVGIITFIKRDYLEHHDIGFAFLARYTKQGYAYEATIAVLKEVTKNPSHKYILATTLEENTKSIQLLEKLGFRFRNTIREGNDLLQVYAVEADKFNKRQKIEIINFLPELKEPIKMLNYEWLEKYFCVEKGDVVSLANPQEQIIDKGGFIYYAKMNDEIVGTASLLKKEENIFELGKMAVTAKAQGYGIGTILLEHCLSVAKQKSIRKLVLYSNTKLGSAIHLYRKYGFTEVILEEGHYERANIKMEKYI